MGEPRQARQYGGDGNSLSRPADAERRKISPRPPLIAGPQEPSGDETVRDPHGDLVRIPDGPSEAFDSTEDLLSWMSENSARYGDIFKASVLGSDVYVVGKPEYCERILRSNWLNYPRKGLVARRIALLLGNGLIAANGEFWASQRRMIQPAFSKTSIIGHTGLMTRINRELLAKWKQAAQHGEAVNVTRDLRSMVLKVTLVALFGDDFPVIEPHASILAEEAARDLNLVNAIRPLHSVILQIAEKRRRDGVDASDFLGIMMRGRERDRGSPMSNAQLAREAMTLVVAGHETTASLLNWLWYLLSRHQAVRTKLEEELDRLPWDDAISFGSLTRYTYTRRVIEEALRLYPPVWLMTRRAEKDDQLGEFFVPAGTEIFISPYLIQRSPSFWEAPEQFDPDRMTAEPGDDRPELALCPFGAGPRRCIGELFSRVETQIHLMLFAKELRLQYAEVQPAAFHAGVNLLSKDDFYMHPELRPRI